MSTTAPRTRLAALAAALTLTLSAAAGCGSDDPGPQKSASVASPPQAGELLGASLRAMDAQQRAHVDLAVDVAGRTADPRLASVIGRPLRARVTGAFSESAIDVTALLEGLGQRQRVEARADRTRSFVRFGGTWYGPGEGLERAAAGSATDPAELRRIVALLREHGDGFVDGEVTPGPDLDGPTWQVTGPLDADGVIAAARAEGAPPTAEEAQGLRLIAPLVRVTFAAGRHDRLPRRFAVRVDLTRTQVQRLRALGADAGSLPLDELRAGFSVDLTRWGAPVRITPPEGDLEPFADLPGAIGGALVAAGAAG